MNAARSAPPWGPQPWLQQHWDARAAVNFMAGGTGSGLVVAAALAGAAGGTRPWLAAFGAALVMLGLLAVWAEIGRPWRALNVLRHPQRSWMTREACAAAVLLAAVAAWLWQGAAAGAAVAATTSGPAGLAATSGIAAFAATWGLAAFAAVAALAFVGCQGRILQAARGIPAWRAPLITPLVVATALAEGLGLALLLLAPRSAAAAGAAVPPALTIAFAAALVARLGLWSAWRRRLHAPAPALAAIDRAGHLFAGSTLLALALWLAALLAPPAALLGLAPALAGLVAMAGGLWFKFALVRRAAFNQGFALPHLPVRGRPHVSPGPSAPRG